MSRLSDLGRMVALRHRMKRPKVKTGCDCAKRPTQVGCGCNQARTGSLMRFYMQPGKGPQFSGQTMIRNERVAVGADAAASASILAPLDTAMHEKLDVAGAFGVGPANSGVFDMGFLRGLFVGFVFAGVTAAAIVFTPGDDE